MKVAPGVAGAGLAVAAAAAAAVWWWIGRSPPPAALFESHCSACHQLPDFTHYRSEEMAGVIEDMSEHLGAADIISDSEARAIARYLEGEMRR